MNVRKLGEFFGEQGGFVCFFRWKCFDIVLVMKIVIEKNGYCVWRLVGNGSFS